MKFNKNWLKENWVAYSVALCLAILFFVLLTNVSSIWTGLGVFYGFVSPVVGGIIVAYLLNPILKFYERTIFSKVRARAIRRGLSLLLTVVSVIMVVAILLVALIPQIVNSIVALVENFDNYAMTLQTLLNNLNTAAEGAQIDISTIVNFGTNLLNSFTQNIPENLSNIVNTSVNIGSGIFSGILAFILAIYFLGDKEHMVGGSKRLFRLILSEEHYNDWADFWGRCNTILLRYIGGELLDALIVGVSNFIFMIISGMPYTVLISVIVGVTNLAPTFGPIVGAILGGFILVLVNPWYALWFLAFTIILQTADGYVIKPKLFGNTLGIASVWILVAIIVFGRIFGIMGVLLAIPFAAIIDFVYREFFLVWLSKRKARLEQEKKAKH